MNKYALGTIVGSALLGLAKKMGGSQTKVRIVTDSKIIAVFNVEVDFIPSEEDSSDEEWVGDQQSSEQQSSEQSDELLLNELEDLVASAMPIIEEKMKNHLQTLTADHSLFDLDTGYEGAYWREDDSIGPQKTVIVDFVLSFENKYYDGTELDAIEDRFSDILNGLENYSGDAIKEALNDPSIRDDIPEGVVEIDTMVMECQDLDDWTSDRYMEVQKEDGSWEP